MINSILPVPLITKSSKRPMTPRDRGPCLTALWRVLLITALAIPNFTIGIYIIFILGSWQISCISWFGVLLRLRLPMLGFFYAPYSYRSCPCGCLSVHVFNMIFVIAVRCKIHSQNENFLILLNISEWVIFSCLIGSFQDFILSWVCALPFPSYSFITN